MKEVTRDEFFAALYADKRDVMPNHENEQETRWETRSRELFGVTKPGWRNPGDKRSYSLARPNQKDQP